MMVESWGFGLEAVNVPCVPSFQGPMGESQVSEAKSASAQPVLPIALPACRILHMSLFHYIFYFDAPLFY